MTGKSSLTNTLETLLKVERDQMYNTVNLLKVKACGKRLGLADLQTKVLCSSTEQI